MEFERSDSAVAVLGLEGFVLLAAVEVDGELHQLVETEDIVVGCPGCGSRALAKGRRRTKVRDLPCGGRPVVVVWAKRIWRCGDADCDVGSWSETSPLIAPSGVDDRARPSRGVPACGTGQPLRGPGRPLPGCGLVERHGCGARLRPAPRR